jgi:hypothetical protein
MKHNLQTERKARKCWWQAYRNTLRIVSFNLLTFVFHPNFSFD